MPEQHEAHQERGHGCPPEPPERPPRQLVERFVASPRAEFGERRRLDEVEEVEEPDPGDAGEDVQPAQQHVEPASGIGEVVEDDSELHVKSSLSTVRGVAKHTSGAEAERVNGRYRRVDNQVDFPGSKGA